MIEDKYLISQYAELLSENPEYGTSSIKYIKEIQEVVDKIGARWVFDYGCGNGWLLDNLRGIQLKARYDPAIPKYAIPFKSNVDLLICTDVLEHIPERDVDDFIANLANYSHIAAIAISYREAIHKLPDGQNCHCTIRKAPWWHKKLKMHYTHVFTLRQGGTSQLLLCKK